MTVKTLKIHTFFSPIPWDDFLTPLPRDCVFDSLPEESLVLAQARKEYNIHVSDKTFFLARAIQNVLVIHQ